MRAMVWLRFPVGVDFLIASSSLTTSSLVKKGMDREGTLGVFTYLIGCSSRKPSLTVQEKKARSALTYPATVWGDNVLSSGGRWGLFWPALTSVCKWWMKRLII